MTIDNVDVKSAEDHREANEDAPATQENTVNSLTGIIIERKNQLDIITGVEHEILLTDEGTKIIMKENVTVNFLPRCLLVNTADLEERFKHMMNSLNQSTNWEELKIIIGGLHAYLGHPSACSMNLLIKYYIGKSFRKELEKTIKP